MRTGVGMLEGTHGMGAQGVGWHSLGIAGGVLRVDFVGFYAFLLLY